MRGAVRNYSYIATSQERDVMRRALWKVNRIHDALHFENDCITRLPYNLEHSSNLLSDRYRMHKFVHTREYWRDTHITHIKSRIQEKICPVHLSISTEITGLNALNTLIHLEFISRKSENLTRTRSSNLRRRFCQSIQLL